MAKVNWINGTIKPPEPGEYYSICVYKKTGEIWIDSDSWDGKCWETLGVNNPYWQVIAWARVLRPDIPADLQGRVKRYFGKEIKNDGTVSKYCDTCKYGKSPCDWCWNDPDGTDNWEWKGVGK